MNTPNHQVKKAFLEKTNTSKQTGLICLNWFKSALYHILLNSSHGDRASEKEKF